MAIRQAFYVLPKEMDNLSIFLQKHSDTNTCEGTSILL